MVYGLSPSANLLSGCHTAIVSGESAVAPRERKLSDSLHLPVLTFEQLQLSACEYYLRFDAAGLSLYANADKAPGAVRVDFSDARLNSRIADSLKHQLLAKAVGIKGDTRPDILDATAGLGKDAYLLASLGCSLTLLERSGIVHALLADGIERGLHSTPGIARVLANMQLRLADLKLVHDGLNSYEVVYLDPMFPETNKRARAKKDMYLLQQLLGSEQDDPELLTVAQRIARKRVVVKRAKHSPYLAGITPNIEFKGSSSRYDVYLV